MHGFHAIMHKFQAMWSVHMAPDNWGELTFVLLLVSGALFWLLQPRKKSRRRRGRSRQAAPANLRSRLAATAQKIRPGTAGFPKISITITRPGENSSSEVSQSMSSRG